MSGGGRSYVKQQPFGDQGQWVERELEAVERGIEDAAYGLRWDDLRFPAQSINPAGAVAAPSVITTESDFPGALSFAGNADNMIAGVAQMPHAWKLGSTIRPHIHWLKPTGSSNAVTWHFYYRIVGNVGGTAGAWVGPVVGTIAAGDQTTSNNHILTSFGDVSMTGYTESAMLAWRIYRIGTSDAENNAVTLLEFDIHYQSDGRGSIPEYPV